MEFCIAQPITEYDVEVAKGQFAGIYSNYFHEPEKLALILLCTMVPFAYEPTSKVPFKHIYTTLDIDFERVLGFKLQLTIKEFKKVERTVSEVLMNDGGVKYAAVALIGADNAEQNPIITELYEGDFVAFRQTVQARYYANKKWKAVCNRGAVNSKHRNILAVDFGAKALTDVEEKFLSDAIESLNNLFTEKEG